jgi:O-antigen ligase/tetratricopeptide (TPR) repeat protein
LSSARLRTALDRALWGTFFVLIAVVFNPFIQVQFTLPKLLVLRALAPFILLLWLARFHAGEVRQLPRPVFVSVCALTGWWIFTTAFAVDPPTALNGAHGRYNGLINQLILVLLFIVVASTAASRKDVEGFLKLLMLALVPVCIYAMFQSVGLDVFSWPNPRPGSTIGHPVPLAAMLSLVAPFALAFFLTEERAPKRSMWAAALFLFLLAVAATLSRGPWAGLAAASLIVLAYAIRVRVIEPKRTWIYGAVAASAILLVLAVAKSDRTIQAVNLFMARVGQLARLQTDPSVMNRFVYFDAARRMLRDHPVAGVGFESYGLLYPRYRPVEGDAVPSDAIPTMVHNGYLQMAVTNGLAAPVLYLLLMASILRLLVRTCRQRVSDRQGGPTARDRLIGAAFIGAIVGYLVQDLSGWQEISLSAFFWPLLGAAVSFCTLPETDSRRETTRPSGRRPARPGARPRTAGLSASVAAASVVVAAGFLTIATHREIRADGLYFATLRLDPSRDWPRIEQDLEASLQLARDDPYYLDAAGLQYLKRLQVTGERQVYDKAAALFVAAAQRDTFNPYVLIHRIDVETAGLMQRAISSPGADVEDVIAKVLKIDSNNATVHESIAQFRLAGNRPKDALVSIRKAESLRPGHPRYHMLEGDTLRRLGHTEGSIEAYRREAAILKGPEAPDWVIAENKLIMSLIESGQHQAAANEAAQVIARMPSYALAHTLRGFAYQQANDLILARESFTRALELNPSDGNTRQALLDVEQRLAISR